MAVLPALIDSLVAGANPLDPIRVAKQHLAEWGNAAPAWSVGYAGLTAQLKRAPSNQFSFDSPGGPDSPAWGLWGGSAPASGPSEMFAAGHVSGQFGFDNVLAFSTTPSDWYVSSALSLAYATREGRPWNPESPVNWETTFGPGGNMQRFLTGLFVVADLNARYTSSTKFNRMDQLLIQGNSVKGMWPYYLDGANALTRIQFDDRGSLTASVTTPPGQPIVIAALVVPVAQFLGG